MEGGKRVPNWGELVCEATEAIIRLTKQIEGIERAPSFDEAVRYAPIFYVAIETKLEELSLEREGNRTKLRIVR